jgi:hypothetical protein
VGCSHGLIATTLDCISNAFFRKASDVRLRAISTRVGVKSWADGKMADGGVDRWQCTYVGEEGALTRDIACVNVRVWDGDHVSSYEGGK